MAKFVLTAELNLRSPKNLTKVVSDIKKALGGAATIRVTVEGAPKATAELKAIEKATANVGTESKKAAKEVDSLGRSLVAAAGHIAKKRHRVYQLSKRRN